MDRKVLGRGLEALFPGNISEKEVESGADKVVSLNINKIIPNRLQPRKNFTTDELRELAGSIKDKGIIQPVLVRRTGENFELIAGERRLRAVKSLDLREIPAIIKDIGDKEALELALIENLQRQDLNPIEEANAYKYMAEKFNLSQEEISRIVGKSRVSVTNSLRLLRLPKEVQVEIENGRISFGHGKALLELGDPGLINRLAGEIITNNLSVRELENAVKAAVPARMNRKRNREQINPLIKQLEELIQQALGTKVRIVRNKKRGRILIEFYSDADLERILSAFKK